MSMRKWSKVRRGDVVQLAGRDWTVEKIKPKGKKLRIAVVSGIHRREAKVRPDGKVKVGSARPAERRPAKRQPVTPPKPASGDPWETQQDRVERKLDKILGARLIAESKNAPEGYYVPPVDISTIAAHLAIFHGVDPSDAGDAETMLAEHAAEHERVLAGKGTLTQNHWHTDKRPTSGKKKG